MNSKYDQLITATIKVLLNSLLVLDVDKEFLQFFLKNKNNKDEITDDDCITTIQLVLFYMFYLNIDKNCIFKYIKLYKVLLHDYWKNLMNYLDKSRKNKINIDFIFMYKTLQYFDIVVDIYDIYEFGILQTNKKYIDFYFLKSNKKIKESNLFNLIEKGNFDLFTHIMNKTRHKNNKINLQYYENEYLLVECSIEFKKLNFLMYFLENKFNTEKVNNLIPIVS